MCVCACVCGCVHVRVCAHVDETVCILLTALLHAQVAWIFEKIHMYIYACVVVCVRACVVVYVGVCVRTWMKLSAHCMLSFSSRWHACL